MGLSNEWTEWHLTPRGWERGSDRVDFGNVTAAPDPEGSVLVYRYSEQQSSMYSKQETSLERVRGDANDPKVIELLASFGPCRERL
jgi:hypothetical protein